MAGRYDIVYPGRARQLFDGGLNSKFERSIINDNESPDCQNVLFSDGAVGSREGVSQLNTASVGTFACDGLFTRNEDSGAETMVAFFGGLGYALGTTTFTTIPSAQSVFTAGTRIGSTQYQNHIFFGNGDASPYKYNGTDFTRHGVPAASGTVSLNTAAGAGDLSSGTYMYRVTYVNSQAVEGDLGSATAGLAVVVSASVDLSDIPTAPQSHGVNSRKIYRTEADGAAYKLVTEITDNTTTTYNDTLADASLGLAAPTDNGEPPNYSIAVYHQNRLFTNDAGNLNYLWYSDLEEPYTFASTNFFKVGDAASDLIKAIDVHQNAVYVFCQRSVWMLYMPSTTDSDWRLIRVGSAYGSRSPFGSFLFQDKMMFPATQSGKLVGFAAIQGASIDPTTTVLENMVIGSELQSEPIEPDIFDIQESNLGDITAHVFQNKAYIAVTKDQGSTSNNYVLIFDFSYERISKSQQSLWVLWKGINVRDFTAFGGKLYGGSSLADGLVYQLEDDTYNDNDAAIDSYFWTKEFSGIPGHENLTKDFRRVKILVDNAGTYDMDLAVRVDSESTSGGLVFPIALTPGGGIWGAMVWGVGSWGGGRAQDEKEIFLSGLSGRRIQFRFSNQNTAGQRFKVQGLNFYYNVRGK